MASPDVVREAALYLEYFLKGMSDCNVIGSYTIQFLELRGFSSRLQTTLAAHLVQLVTNMKGLLMKINATSVSHAQVQTEEASSDGGECPLCRSHPATHMLPQEEAKTPLRASVASDKSYEPPELVQLLSSSPLMQLKQEISCIPDPSPAAPTSASEGVVGDLKHLKQEVGRVREVAGGEGSMEKCVLGQSVSTPLEGNMELSYVASSQLEDDAQEEILLGELNECSDSEGAGLVYVYTMSPCGSLQLVRRVVSKSATSRDPLHQPVEQATIDISDLKAEEHKTEASMEHLILREDIHSTQPEASQEQLIVAPDLTSYEGEKVLQVSEKEPSKAKIKRNKKSTMIIATEGSNVGTIIPDIVKMGPEDLDCLKWCNICQKEFPSAGSLKVHLSRSHCQVRRCHTCTKTINTDEEMREHVQECHADLPFICCVCGQSLRTNAAFQRHMDIHKGHRGSACEVCGQTFSRTEYYREHKRVHTGERPYKCVTCKKTFSRSSNLYTHMRIHSNKEQRHMCTVCTKSFARADKLKDHMIRHLQIKRYACRLCPKAYNEKRDLTKHLENVHTSKTGHGT